jgi:signal recognition particle subunit SRP54
MGYLGGGFMFSQISEKFQDIFKKLRGHGKLTPENIKESLRAVRMALLEADVNYKVVKTFIDRVEARAVGQEVLKSLAPGQQVVKIVHDELVELLGKEPAKFTLASIPPTIVLLVGLQGSGKTTFAAKLALHFIKKGKKVMLAAADTYRPAAQEQLKILARQVGAEFFMEGKSPLEICRIAKKKALESGCDLLILDTAGRTQIDTAMIAEAEEIKKTLSPQEVILVADAMTGQEAVNVALGFDKAVSLTGVALTKMDGDARGGAALSLRAVTGKPIKLAGVGEKVEDLEFFYPERMASRILGMGDVLTLVEKAQETVDLEKAAQLQKKILQESFSLEDFLEQLRQVKKMGSLTDMAKMIPGFSKMAGEVDEQESERELKKTEAIILSMTPQERRQPEILNGRRRSRIAQGSGTTVSEVNRLLKQFAQMQKMMKQLGKMQKGKGGLGKLMKGLGGK